MTCMNSPPSPQPPKGTHLETPPLEGLNTGSQARAPPPAMVAAQNTATCNRATPSLNTAALKLNTPIRKVSIHLTTPSPRPSSPPTRTLPHPAITLEEVTHQLDTLTDLQMAAWISSLPDTWSAPGPHGTPLTKQALTHSAWGEYKGDETIREFLIAILQAYPPPAPGPAVYDVLQSGIIANSPDHLLHRNPCLQETGPHTHPLQNGLAVFMLHHSSHFTTLVLSPTDGHYYDSLAWGVPENAHSIRNNVHNLYEALTDLTPRHTANSPTSREPTPAQTDPVPWSCGIHMLCSTLSAIYQNQVPVLHYTQQHVNQLHRAQLRYLVTGELDEWIGELVALLTAPHPPPDLTVSLPRRPSAGGRPRTAHAPAPLPPTRRRASLRPRKPQPPPPSPPQPPPRGPRKRTMPPNTDTLAPPPLKQLKTKPLPKGPPGPRKPLPTPATLPQQQDSRRKRQLTLTECSFKPLEPQSQDSTYDAPPASITEACMPPPPP